MSLSSSAPHFRQTDTANEDDEVLESCTLLLYQFTAWALGTLVRRSAKKPARGCEKFLPALAFKQEQEEI